ncbi:MAG: hypothetical protein HGB16_02240 [Chlorobaculum sp.]|nr:hypothetical protein [Chlorobaculum sp.]
MSATTIDFPEAALDFFRIFFQNRFGDAFVFNPMTNNFSADSHGKQQSRRGLGVQCIRQDAMNCFSGPSGKLTHDRKTFQKVQNEAIAENRKLIGGARGNSPNAISCFSGCSRMRSRIILLYTSCFDPT